MILTSNIGSELYKSTGIGFGEGSQTSSKERTILAKAVTARLKDRLSPAILSRVQSVCIFNQLTEDNLRTIIQKHIEKLSGMLEQEQKISITPDTLALDALIHDTRDRDLGVRTIERKLERIIEELVIAVLGNNKKKTYTLTHKKDRYLLS